MKKLLIILCAVWAFSIHAQENADDGNPLSAIPVLRLPPPITATAGATPFVSQANSLVNSMEDWDGITLPTIVEENK